MMAAPATRETVAIAGQARRSIAEVAAAAFPEEACGVLVGHAGAPGRIAAAFASLNRLSGDRTRRFALAPQDLYALTLRARGMAMDVIGFFHSHPAGEARPSPSDIRDATAWPGYLHAIFACAPREGDALRLYRTDTLEWHELIARGWDA